MIFRDFAVRALGSKAKIKVLMHLLGEGMPVSERQLALLLGLTPLTVNRVMKEFHELGLVTPLRIGRATTWKLVETSYAFKKLACLKELASEPPLAHLEKKLQAFHSHARDVILFGSIAEKTEVPSSDIDVLVIVENEEAKKKLTDMVEKLGAECIMEYGNRLSVIMATPDEAKAFPEEFKKQIERGIRIFPLHPLAHRLKASGKDSVV